MPKPFYPSTLDLELFLSGLGLPQVADKAFQDKLNLPAQITSAIAEWERATRWSPFLAATQTRTFQTERGPGNGGYGWGGLNGFVNDYGYGGGGNSSDNLLQLDGGLLSIDSLSVSVTSANPDGQALTQGVHYWPMPDNAPQSSKPYTYIRFAGALYGMVKITGTFGYASAVPDDVWNAILQYGAAQVLPQITFAVSGGLDSWTEAGVSEKYGAQFSKHGELWSNNFDRVAMRYRRILM